MVIVPHHPEKPSTRRSSEVRRISEEHGAKTDLSDRRTDGWQKKEGREFR